MKFAVVDEDGFALAFCASEIYGDAIPSGAIEITEEQRRDLSGNEGRRNWANGAVAAFEPPTLPEPVPPMISDRQFFQPLALDGEVSEAEALAAIATGTIPIALATAIGTLPNKQQFAANMFLQGATTFERAHPMTLALATLMGWDDGMLSALWTIAAQL